MKGYVHSLESFGTVDGPGVRYVVFFQGCPMRCMYCHNPDTWEFNKGMQLDSKDIIEKITRNSMFYTSGGITATGGEPTMQMEFLIDLFTRAKQAGIHTCLDTSGIGYALNRNLEQFESLVKVTDLVMLDIKHMDPAVHKKLTGQTNEGIFAFARFLEERKIPLWIRHVVVPGITEDEQEWKQLGKFIKTLSNFEHLEVLPYHTMGKQKYELLNLEYALKDTEPLTEDVARRAEAIILGKRIRKKG